MYQTRSLLGKVESCAHVRPSSAERQICVSEPVGLPNATPLLSTASVSYASFTKTIRREGPTAAAVADGTSDTTRATAIAKSVGCHHHRCRSTTAPLSSWNSRRGDHTLRGKSSSREPRNQRIFRI